MDNVDKDPKDSQVAEPHSVPCVLFIFRRPHTTEKVLRALKRAQIRKIYVIADGPREGNLSESELVLATRDLVDELITWNCTVVKIYSSLNLGLRQRVISGLDEVFQIETAAIILEDDCEPSESFFPYAAELLKNYRSDLRVGLVSGNNFAPDSGAVYSYYFSTNANIWGWATWARTWRDFRKTRLDDYLTEMGRAQISKAIPGRFQRRSFLRLLRQSKSLDSWAIQFSAFCYSQGLLTIVPKVNLVRNIGFGADSTHTKFESYVDEVEAKELTFPLNHPDKVTLNLRATVRESRLKALKWVAYPLGHPIDFFRRVWRYVMFKASEGP